MADSTLAMRRSVYDRAVAGELSKLKLREVTPQRLKHLCDEVKEKRSCPLWWCRRPLISLPT